jgi:hypothetical protein
MLGLPKFHERFTPSFSPRRADGIAALSRSGVAGDHAEAPRELRDWPPCLIDRDRLRRPRSDDLQAADAEPVSEGAGVHSSVRNLIAADIDGIDHHG